LLLTSCCLDVADGLGTGGTGTVGTSGGSGATTGSITRPDSGPSSCTGFFCAPNFVCDTTDGFCKCDGQLCASGNCTADGTCLPGCPADGGAGTLMLTVGPASNGIPPPGSSKAIVLPTASLG